MLDITQNLGNAFLTHALVNSGDWIQHMLQSELSPLQGLPHYQAVMQLVHDTLAERELSKTGEDQPWALSLHTTFQTLLGCNVATPNGHEGEWDQSYIKRILVDVGTQLERFNFLCSSWSEIDYLDRPLSDRSENTRLGLARSLKKLPCVVNRCDGADCKAHYSSSICLPYAQIYSAANRLLDGAADEVTPAVRREVFRALRRAIDHYTVNALPNGLRRIGEFLMQHIKDPDRNARLAAW